MAIQTFPDFYSWVTQTRGEQVNPDTGEPLRPDQLTGNRYQELQDQYREARFAWEDQTYPEITGPDGQVWAPMLSTTENGRIPTTVDSISGDPRTQQIFGGKITEHNGVAYAPRSILTNAEVTGSADNGFIQNFMNGPGAVLLPAIIATAGTAAAAAAAGGGAAGAAPPASYWSTLAEAGGATATDVGAGIGALEASGAAATTLPATTVTASSLAGAGAGSGLGTVGAGLLGGVLGGSILSSLTDFGTPLTEGGTYTETQPTTQTTTEEQFRDNFDKETMGQLAAYGLTGAAATTFLDDLKKYFPGVTASSLLSGLGQGALGYLGAQKQADAYESAADKQNAAIREAIAQAEKARVEQNAAYGKAYDASVTARGVQNSYIQQAIDEIKRGQVTQDAAIQQGIDYSKGASDKYFGLGAQYRGLLSDTYKPGYSVWDDSATRDAAGQAADYAARGYSATAGNPFDQPASQGGIYRDVLAQVALPQLNKTREQLGSFGQLGLTQAGAMDQLTASGLASLGNNDMLAAPGIASLGNNAFQGINYLANQADSGKYTDLIASLGNNAFQGVQNAGSGLNAIGAGVSTALNPPLTKQDLLDFMKTYKPTV